MKRFPGNHVEMGLIDQAGAFVEAAFLDSHLGRTGQPPAEIGRAVPVDRDVLFCDPLFSHYGHFLIESLSRLWAVEELPGLALAFPINPGGQGCMRPYQKEILDILGVKRDIVLVNRPMRFNRVLLPTPGTRMQDIFTARQARFLGRQPQVGDRDARIWISRRGYPSSQTLGIGVLEDHLESRGWKIYQPERDSVSEQLRVFAGARRIAGEMGSAFHTLVLLEDCSDLRVDIIARHPDHPGRQTMIYKVIAATKGLKQTIHVIPSERMRSREGNVLMKHAGTLEDYCVALEPDL